MAKSKKKKQKNNTKTQKKLDSRQVIIFVSVILFAIIMAISTGLFLHNASMTVSVAFFDLPEAFSADLEKQISKGYKRKVTFTKIENQKLDVKKTTKKYDLFFCWDGAVADSFNAYTIRPSSVANSALPTSIRRGEQKKLPLALDHFELDYYKKARASAGLEIPENLNELQDYLEVMKAYVFTPFFCAGKDDRTLLGLITVITESLGGAEAVNALEEKLSSYKTISQISDEIIGKNNSGETFTLRNVLDILRTWQAKEYVHPNWTDSTEKDVIAFMDANQIGVAFMLLSDHRELPFEQVKKFELARFPTLSNASKHALVAPGVVCLKFSKNQNCDEVLELLVSENGQTEFSDATRLAPVASRAASYDRLSDDVRFWAASCRQGQITDLYNALYQTNPDGAHFTAESFRQYLKSGEF